MKHWLLVSAFVVYALCGSYDMIWGVSRCDNDDDGYLCSLINISSCVFLDGGPFTHRYIACYGEGIVTLSDYPHTTTVTKCNQQCYTDPNKTCCFTNYYKNGSSSKTSCAYSLFGFS